MACVLGSNEKGSAIAVLMRFFRRFHDRLAGSYSVQQPSFDLKGQSFSIALMDLSAKFSQYNGQVNTSETRLVVVLWHKDPPTLAEMLSRQCIALPARLNKAGSR